MKLNQAKIKIITEATAAALETAVNTWLESQREETAISFHITEVGGTYTAYIVYTK